MDKQCTKSAWRCVGDVPQHPGWCAHLEGGGPAGVDRSATVRFYDPEGRAYWPYEAPEEIFDDWPYPTSKNTYFG